MKLGAHNKDKNGELIIQGSVEIKMKKLSVSYIRLQV